MYYLFDQTFPFLAHVPSCPRALPTAAVPAKSVKYKVFFSTAAPCGGPRMCVLNINSECTTKLYHRGGGVLQDRLQYRRSTVYAWCGESISRHGTANRGAASKLLSSSKVCSGSRTSHASSKQQACAPAPHRCIMTRSPTTTTMTRRTSDESVTWATWPSFSSATAQRGSGRRRGRSGPASRWSRGCL